MAVGVWWAFGTSLVWVSPSIVGLGDYLLGGCFWIDTLPASCAHAFAFEDDAMSVVDQAVEDGVGEGGITEIGVPAIDGELAGDEGGALAKGDRGIIRLKRALFLHGLTTITR